jgi:uncharacterized protein (TIGR03545 family)
VADREQPLRNLFELGATRISIDVLRLLEGRVHVRALECRDVRWDTPRERSGARAIPGSAAEEAAVEAVMEGGGGAGRSGLEKAAAGVLRAVDIPSLVDAQVAGLASTAKLEAANRRLETLTESWTANVEKGRAGIEGLSADIEKIRVFDYSKVASLKDAQALLGAVSSAAPKVKALSTSLAAAARQLSADLESAQAETASLRAALAADAASLAAKLDLSGGGWKSLASGLASRLLEKYLGRYSRWVLRGKDAVVRLAANRPGRSKGRPLARTGRTIAYPGAASPRFLLSQAAFSIAERADMPAIAATLRDVTSDPDALGRPAVLHASAARGAQALSLQASIDARSTGSSDAEVSLSAENWPLELREGLEPLSLGSLSAKAGIGMEVRLPGGGGFEGEGTVVLDSIALRPLASGDPLGDALAGALASVRKARLDFELSQPAGAGPTVSARTDLDEVLSKAAAAQGAKLAAQYEAKISAELKSRLQAELAKNEALASTLAGLEKSAAADLATAGSFQKVLADAQRSLEKKLKSAVPLPKLGF